MEQEINDNIKVLAVDDQPGSQRLMERYFEASEKPVNIETAANVEEALGKLEEKRYDAVIADYRLPGRNGLELASEIDENTFFILHTGTHSREIEKEANLKGADCYMVKDAGRQYFQKLIDKIYEQTKTN